MVPSERSYNALNVFWNGISDTECSYHFPVNDINTQPSNVVIVRNLPSPFYLESRAGYELKTMNNCLNCRSTLCSCESYSC